ncbi:MAG: hypothetical protein R3276_02285 [Marinobacter sp.]|nr:hypothetical protein [Marinobacter sp.]
MNYSSIAKWSLGPALIVVLLVWMEQSVNAKTSTAGQTPCESAASSQPRHCYQGSWWWYVH